MESFGAPLLDAAANRELFEEQVEVLLKCFNEEAFSHKGKYYEIPPPVDYRGYRLSEITCVPRPTHGPVEILDAHRQRQEHRLHGPPQLQGHGHAERREDPRRGRARYHAACLRHGHQKQLGEDVIWGSGMYLADTQAEAARRVEPAHDERYKWFAPLGSVRYADEQGRTWGTPGAPARTPFLRDGIEQKAWFCGPPSHVIEGIKSIEARYPGLEHYMIHFAEGLPLEEFKKQLRWFARDIMPAFRR